MTATKTRSRRIRGFLLVIATTTVGSIVLWNGSLVDSCANCRANSSVNSSHGAAVWYRVTSKASAQPITSEAPDLASVAPPLRPLNFVHIPKTGGSSIETLATEVGLFWGKCLFVAQDTRKRLKNARHTKFVQCPPERFQPPVTFSIDDMERRGAKPLWHTPPAYYPRRPTSHGAWPYRGFDLFAVLRNPYTRVLSVYYYQMKLVHKSRHFTLVNDPATLNAFVQENVQKTLACLAAWNLTECMIRDQFIPQYMYVLDKEEQNHTHAVSPPRRVVEHWLRFEHLHQDFDALMDRYGHHNLTSSPLMSQRTTNQRDSKAILDPRDLTQATVLLLQELYAKDFALGGYSMDPMDA
jgi:hypothetical protein